MLKVVESTQEFDPVGVTRRRRPFRRVAAVTLGCIVVIGAVVGGLFWQATRSSISLGYLNNRVESAIAQRLPAEARVQVGSTAFSYRGGQGAILRIRDLALLLPGIATVSVGELSTVTDAAALLGGRIDLHSVTITGVDIGVSGAPAALRGEGTGADLVRRMAMSFMDQVIEADILMRDAGLKEVIVRDASIRMGGQAGGIAPRLRIGEANWLPLSPNRSKAWMQIVDKSGTGWDLTLERRETQFGNIAVTLEFEDVPVAALAPELARDDGGPYFRSTVTLQTRMARDAQGKFLGLRGMLSTADGELSVTGVDKINVASTALNFALDADGDRLAIPSGEIRTHTGYVAFEAAADLAELGHTTVVGNIRNGALSTPIGEKKSVHIIGGGGMARVNFADLGMEIERLQLVTPDGIASVIGQASLAGPTPGVSFALSMTELPAATVRALWPPFVADKLRLWFDINVKSGTLGPATLQVALPPDHIGPRNRGKVLPRYALVGSLPFREAEFSPISTFPAISNASGEIAFANATANIVAQSGIIAVPGKGVLQAAGTGLVVPELGRAQPRGDLHLELSGPATALAQVSNTPPLSVARDRALVPENLSGEAALSLDVNIPLYAADFAGVIPNFRLALTDFSSTTPIEGRSVGEANLVLEGNPRSYTVKGDGKLDGYQASVDLIQGSAAPDQSAVIVELDDEARKRMGIGFGQLVTGPVQAYLMNTGELGQQVALDLKQTRINLPFLGWEKGPGVPATASFVMDKTAEGTQLSKFLLSGKGFEVRGDLSIGTDGRLKEMTLERVALRPGDQLSATVTANDRGYDVQITGSVLDARGIIGQVGAQQLAGDADIFPVRVSLDIDVVRGQNDVSLSGIAGTMTITRKGLDAVSLKGNANSNQPFEWTLTRDGDTRTLRVFASAGGALIRFAGIYSRVGGGNLVVDYSGKVDGGGSGVMVLHDFRLINEAALRSVLEPASPRAGMVHSYSPTGGDFQFSQLRIPFRQERWVINIDDAALRGASIGATASGTINVPDSKMAISGTLIPAFGINNIAGAIPLLGAILGGGRDEGLVGITYKLFGPLDQPELVVNPISAIAPGIFRKIFEYR
ncbi:MAG: DUF3971 domain-containing protein [Propylenella sp.]